MSGVEQLFAISRLDSSHYLTVGYTTGISWFAEVTTATGGLVGTPSDAGSGYLQGVSCPTVTRCVAVGFDGTSSKPAGSSTDRSGAVAIFKVTGVATRPSAPAVTVSQVRATSFRVTVHKPGSDRGADVSSYEIRVRDCAAHHKGCKLDTVKEAKVTTKKPAFTFTGLKKHTTYIVDATATNAIGTSPWSTRVTVTSKK